MQSHSTPARSSTDSSNPRAGMGAGFMVSLSQTPVIYRCAYCSRTFLSAQALGGHQNAHRRDRIQARKRFVQERLAFMNKVKPLTPSPPPAIPSQLNPCFEQFIPPPPPPVAQLLPTYDPALGLLQPGVLGYGPQSALGFQSELGFEPLSFDQGLEIWLNTYAAGPSGPAGYNNFPNGEAHQGNYYYQPYQRSTDMSSAQELEMARPWDTGTEASSDTAESRTYDPKAEINGSYQDRNETTSKKRIVIDLTLSP